VSSRRPKQERRSIAQEVTRILDEAPIPQQPMSILDLEGRSKELMPGTDPVAHVEAEHSARD